MDVRCIYAGGGGHSILNDGGAELTQRESLQFKGTYTRDNSTNSATEVNVTRTMTSSAFELLSEEEKKGLINVTDEYGDAVTADDIAYDSDNSVKDVIDNSITNIAPIATSPTSSAIYKGSHFMYNGVRMVATSAIANGDTLVVYPTSGYNCKAESVEENIKCKLIFNIPSNTYASFSLALAALKPYFDALSTDEKKKSYMQVGDITANLFHSNDGRYSWCLVTAGTGYIVSLKLSSNTYEQFEFTASGNTYSDKSSSQQSLDLALWVRG